MDIQIRSNNQTSRPTNNNVRPTPTYRVLETTYRSREHELNMQWQQKLRYRITQAGLIGFSVATLLMCVAWLVLAHS
jgi:hypothetical protein